MELQSYQIHISQGLLDVVHDCLPQAEHRKCTRHVYANFKKKYRLQYQRLFWAATSCTLQQQFELIMDKIRQIDQTANDYLFQRNPNSWSRALFEMDRRYVTFENGISESFNRAILGPRHKPIITILEEIRLYIMQRLVAMNKIAFSLEDRITPSIRKRDWVVFPSGFQELEVRKADESYSVNVLMKQISGVGRTMTCKNCWQKSHNKASCKANPQPKPLVEKKQPGRKKYVVVGQCASRGGGSSGRGDGSGGSGSGMGGSGSGIGDGSGGRDGRTSSRGGRRGIRGGGIAGRGGGRGSRGGGSRRGGRMAGSSSKGAKTITSDGHLTTEESIFSSCYLFRNPFSSTTMGDENPIRTLGDYSKPSHEGYRNTIELPVGNNVCEIDCAAGGKLRDKNTDESWEIIENLALYDHEGWDETKEFVKPVKAISTPQGVSKTPDRRLLELEDQINFLLRGSRPTPAPSSAHPQAYVNAVHPNSRPQNQNEPPILSTFAFRERTGPSPQPRALDTTFEARVRDYMAAHTERMERFENTIFKQREEINGRMTEMFGLLKELTTSRTPEKVLIREEAKFPVTKNVNSISLARNEDEENNKTDETPDNTKMPTEMEMPVRKAEAMNGAENGTENEPVKTPKNDEVVEAPGSQPVAYYLKHKINEKLIKGLVNNNRFNNSLSGTRVGKKKKKAYNVLPGGLIAGLKHVHALVDQGSDVNVMPYSTYMKLTDERPAETDIRLSLASHSYIYPLGIAEDVLVEVAEHIYPADFVIMDIKENEKRPFILGMPFLTTAKASIKFDIGTITLRSGKSKISFYRIPEPLSHVEKGIKNDIEPIAPTMTVNRLILEWEERIRLHQEKEMEFNQWRSKNFKDERPALTEEEEGVDDEGEVTLYLMRRSLKVLRKFHWMILGGRFKQLSHVSSPLLSKPREY
ncbi:MAK10-like protein [Tanacetum coccineum]